MSWLTEYIKEALDLNGGRREDEKAVMSYLEVLLTHMLKCKYQNSYENKSSWRASIKNSYKGIIKAFRGALKGTIYNNYYLKTLDLDLVYDFARDNAIEETGRPKECFPYKCPWTKKQLVDRNFIDDFIEEYGWCSKEERR